MHLSKSLLMIVKLSLLTKAHMCPPRPRPITDFMIHEQFNYLYLTNAIIYAGNKVHTSLIIIDDRKASIAHMGVSAPTLAKADHGYSMCFTGVAEPRPVLSI